MTLIDTAEIYGGGRSEELIGHAIAGQRDRVFLVSKVTPIMRRETASRVLARRALPVSALIISISTCCTGAVSNTELSGVVAAFESLRAAGKICAWGVSNFKVSDMGDLFRVPHGDRCATNQVRYNVDSRGIERDLLPWCEQHGMPVMAYSPLGGNNLGHDPTLWSGSAKHTVARRPRSRWPGPSAAATLSQFLESGSAAHVKENAAALSLMLTPQARIFPTERRLSNAATTPESSVLLTAPVEQVEIEMISAETGKARLASTRDAVSRHMIGVHF